MLMSSIVTGSIPFVFAAIRRERIDSFVLSLSGIAVLAGFVISAMTQLWFQYTQYTVCHDDDGYWAFVFMLFRRKRQGDEENSAKWNDGH